MDFEWDDHKATGNLVKHGIDFEDAISIFAGPVLEFASDRQGEPRRVAIGMLEDREITVVYTIRGGVYRIISARRARRRERQAYHQAHP